MRSRVPVGLAPLVAALAAAGCLSGTTSLSDARPRTVRAAGGSAPSTAASPYSSRLIERLQDRHPPAPVQLAGQVVPASMPASQPELGTILSNELLDPTEAEAGFRRRFAALSERLRSDYEFTNRVSGQPDGIFPKALRYIREIERPNKFYLSLADCLWRTLASNYQVRIQGYGPAISTAQIVQAEAAFDAALFGTISRDNSDRPVAVRLQAGQSLTNIYTAGVRQRLATGASVTISQTLGRQDVPGFQFQVLNPAYTTGFLAEVRQPLLRNFGVDFNRAQIDIARNTRDISLETFRRQVITSLNDAERAYWTLVGARRQVVISAELLAQAERTYDQVKAREDYDAFATLIANSQATVQSRRAEFIRVKNDVRNAEDALRNLMNDPELNLGHDVEIVPTEQLVSVPVVRDRVRDVEIALQNRPEINESRLAIENARIQLGVAKNQALPTLDVVFRHTINGLGANADQSFDQLTSAHFYDTFVALEFAWNFAERGERAGIRLAALQHSSAVAAFKAALDNVITDCRVTGRALDTSFEQLYPSTEAVKAARENLRSVQERAESKSPEQLNTIFNTQSQVATTRQALLQALVTYNQSIVELERAKGTLLEFNNVVLTDAP